MQISSASGRAGMVIGHCCCAIHSKILAGSSLLSSTGIECVLYHLLSEFCLVIVCYICSLSPPACKECDFSDKICETG